MKLQTLKESSLSRIHSKISAGTVGTITAYRSEFTEVENRQRNRSLVAKLTLKGYGITAVSGSYIENYETEDAKEVSEHSYMVAPSDERTAASLEADLIALGREFDQDSVLVIKGGKGELVGTSQRENAWPSYGKREPLGGFKGGKAAQFMSRVNGRSYVFEDIEYPGTINGIWGVTILAEKRWQDIEVE